MTRRIGSVRRWSLERSGWFCAGFASGMRNVGKPLCLGDRACPPRDRMKGFADGLYYFRFCVDFLIVGDMERHNHLVVVGTDELRSLVRAALIEALAEHQSGGAAPELLGRTDAARSLSVSTSMIDRLRKEGMPCVWLGDSPRFRIADCVVWLQSRHAGAGRAP